MGVTNCVLGLNVSLEDDMSDGRVQTAMTLSARSRTLKQSSALGESTSVSIRADIWNAHAKYITPASKLRQGHET